MKFILYHPTAFERWDYRNVDKGIGGSETHQIEMAWRLASRGHEVISYAPIPGDCERQHRGVEWRHLDEVDWSEDGLWIVYRSPSSGEKLQGQRAWLLCQDWDYPDMTEENTASFELVLPLCIEHDNYLTQVHSYLKGKTWITSNGLRMDLIRDLQPEERNPKRVMYASSPDRGLLYVLQTFVKAQEFVDDIELHVFYGFNNIDILGKSNPKDPRYLLKKQVEPFFEKQGIFWHGRVSQRELYQEWLKSAIWLYQTNFLETSCCPPGTRIMTQRGEVDIEKIQITDQVWTHEGRFQSISKIMSRHYAGDLIKIKVQSSDDLLLTSKHPVLIIRGKSVVDSFRSISTADPMWIEAKDIQQDDCVLYSRMKEESVGQQLEIVKLQRDNDPFSNRIELPFESIVLDDVMSWWIGYFCGDGSASIRTGKVNVLLAKKHLEHKDKLLHGLKRFGLKIKCTEYKGFYDYYIYNRQIAKTLRKYCYDGTYKVIPEQAMNKHALEGLLAADGYDYSKNRTFTNISPRLIGQVRQLLSAQGISVRAVRRIHEKGQDSYTQAWTNNPTTLYYGVTNKYILNRVKKVERVSYNGMVYNLEVNTDNTYTANGHIVHNCISCMEAQALGAIPITNPIGALAQNVMGGIVIHGDAYNDRLVKGRYLGELIRLLTNTELQEAIRQPMAQAAMYRFNWERIVDQWERFLFGIDSPYIREHHLFQRIHAEGKILNVGCDIDTPEFGKIGINVDCSTVNPRHGYPMKAQVVADARKLPFSGKFDSVVLGEVLEHMTYEDGVLALQNCREATKPGGKVIITCPVDDRGLPGDGVLYTEGCTCDHRLVEKEELLEMVSAAGLQVDFEQEIDCMHMKDWGLVCYRASA